MERISERAIEREQNCGKTIETKTLKQNQKRMVVWKARRFLYRSVCVCFSFNTRCYFFFCCCSVYFVIALLIHFDKNKIVADHCWLCVDLVSDFIDFQCVQYSSCNWPFIRKKTHNIHAFMVHCHSNTRIHLYINTRAQANKHSNMNTQPHTHLTKRAARQLFVFVCLFYWKSAVDELCEQTTI